MMQIPHSVAFHLGLQCWPKYLLMGFQYKRVKSPFHHSMLILFNPFPVLILCISWEASKQAIPGLVAQLSACITADPGVASLFPAQSHTFVEIDHFYCHSPTSADSRKVVVSYKGMYVHKVLVNCLVQLAQDKSVVR